VFTVVEAEQVRILVRHYQANRDDGGLSLTPVEPAFNLVSRRTKLPDTQIMAIALVKPVTARKKKNIERDDLGRVFVRHQEWGR
jgi:hypothetical protein